MQLYLLASHVYPCVTDDHLVLLDLQRDKYVGVDREQMASLARCVKGWPWQAGAAPAAANPRGEAVIGKMLAAGMLTTDPAFGKEVQPVEVSRAEVALVEEDLESQPRITTGHVVRFLFASTLTALSMKLKPIERVIASLRARKGGELARHAAPVDLNEARALVAAFIRLRPLLFGAQDACLFDSLALMRFLSYYGVFPTCVIGVQTGPFAAHCWVQHEDVVFNDAPEYVRRYTPILTV